MQPASAFTSPELKPLKQHLKHRTRRAARTWSTFRHYYTHAERTHLHRGRCRTLCCWIHIHKQTLSMTGCAYHFPFTPPATSKDYHSILNVDLKSSLCEDVLDVGQEGSPFTTLMWAGDGMRDRGREIKYHWERYFTILRDQGSLSIALYFLMYLCLTSVRCPLSSVGELHGFSRISVLK